jgi:hypothetical protein
MFPDQLPFGKLNEYKTIALRFEKTECNFTSVINLCAAVINLGKSSKGPNQMLDLDQYRVSSTAS